MVDQNKAAPEQLKLQLKRLYYEDRLLLENLNLSVKRGEKILLMGATGSGKTSLLNTLNLMNMNYEGDIYFEGKELRQYNAQLLRSRIITVMQEPWLGDALVKEALSEPFGYMAIRKRGITENQESILRLLKAFELPAEHLEKKAEQLSGGEKQRLALLRALILQPEILLLDEISSALDQETSRIISQIIFHQFPGTVIAISHDPLWQNSWERRWEIKEGRILDNGAAAWT